LRLFEISENAHSGLCISGRKESQGRVIEVAWPNEVISTHSVDGVVRIRNCGLGERGDDRAAIALVLVHLDDLGGAASERAFGDEALIVNRAFELLKIILPAGFVR